MFESITCKTKKIRSSRESTVRGKQQLMSKNIELQFTLGITNVRLDIIHRDKQFDI